MIKTMHDKVKTKGLTSLESISTLYHEFFIRKDYEWWYRVSPGDIIVDVGACNGMFTCFALDNGAKIVYTIEPNIELLETAVINAFPHIVNKPQSPVIPINCAIGDPGFSDDYKKHIHGEITDKKEIPVITFKNFLKEYNITHIDYLKIDAEGAEYNILCEENLHFIKENVKHIAVEVHLDAFKEAPQKFINFRNNFLSHFSEDKIKYLYPEDKQKTYNDSFILSKWPIGWGGCWMIYICNKSLP